MAKKNTTAIQTKLSVGSMGLDKETLQRLVLDSGSETISVCRIFGKASRYTEKPNKNDPTKSDIAFLGQFEGVNLITGEVFNSGRCYLPTAAQDLARGAVDSLEDGQGYVIFGCSIGVIKSAKSAVGYQFVVDVPREPEAQDALSEIRALMASEDQEGPPALPAPKKAKGK